VKATRVTLLRTPIALLALFVLASALPGSAQDGVWEVRRAQATDQKDEWTQMGRIPAWEVTISPGEPATIEIGGDEEGAFRGFVLIGRRWRVPGDLPPVLRMALKYQTYCAMNSEAMPRSGNAMLALITPERWEQFALKPEAAERWNGKVDGTGVLAAFPIHEGLDDVTQWREWRSGNMTPRLRSLVGQEVVLAIVWWAAHFCEEWARFTSPEVQEMTEDDLDRELFAEFDLERPELAPVKLAVEAEDLQAAREAMAQHLRTREYPVGPNLSPDGSQRGIKTADEIVDHVFRFVGCPPTKIEGDIRWNEDPHNYDQWAIAFNRHTHWVTLGRAYAATGDEKYAREFVAQLNSWISAMPVHIGAHWVQGPFFESGKNPLTLDAGIRMAHSWWPAYYYFKDSPNFDVNSQVRMLRSFRDHALYLMNRRHFRPTSNWGAMETNGLLHIAVMLPEFREAGTWLETARDRLVEALKAQVYPDGAQIELAPGYHGVTLANFVQSLQVAQRNGIDLPPEFVAGLEKMFECWLAISAPDFRTPQLNDSGRSGITGWLAQGLKLFPEREDFEYAASVRRQGKAPGKTSWLLPYAGWAVMRSGWRADDIYLHFDTGPFGAGHQHEDKLSLLVYAGGKMILTEGGNYAYDSSDWRRYILSTRAHNTVMVDGREQSRRRLHDTFVQWEPEQRRWITNDDLDYAEGVYDSGYGTGGELQVTHTRQVVFVKPDYWIVVDTLTPGDDAEHEYEAMFHLDAEEAAIDEETQTVTVEHDGGGFRIAPLAGHPFDVEIVQGQTEPTVQGWLPTGKHNVLRPIPTAIYRWRATGPSVMAYALVPRESRAPWAVSSTRSIPSGVSSALVGEITLAGGGKDLIIRRAEDDPTPLEGPVDTDAELAFVRLGADGKVSHLLQIGGAKTSLRTTP